MRGLVGCGIARFAPGGGMSGHWVVLTDGYFVDPADGQSWAPEDFVCIYEARGLWLVSLLPVSCVP